jgi:hypothetical protein
VSGRGELYLTRVLGDQLEGAKQAGGGGPRRLVVSGGGGRAGDDQIHWPETKAVRRLVLWGWGDGGRAASLALIKCRFPTPTY